MLRAQAVAVGLLVGGVLLAGYINKYLRNELDSVNRTLLAIEQSLPTTEKEMKDCTKQLEEFKDRITRVENDKIELTANLTNLEKEFDNLKPHAPIFQEKNKEIEELEAKLKTTTESEGNERKKLEEVQDALEKLAKELEERNAKKAEKESKEGKALAAAELGKNSDSKKQ